MNLEYLLHGPMDAMPLATQKLRDEALKWGENLANKAREGADRRAALAATGGIIAGGLGGAVVTNKTKRWTA